MLCHMIIDLMLGRGWYRGNRCLVFKAVNRPHWILYL